MRTYGTPCFDWMEESLVTLWINGWERLRKNGPYLLVTFAFMFQSDRDVFEDFEN